MPAPIGQANYEVKWTRPYQTNKKLENTQKRTLKVYLGRRWAPTRRCLAFEDAMIVGQHCVDASITVSLQPMTEF